MYRAGRPALLKGVVMVSGTPDLSDGSTPAPRNRSSRKRWVIVLSVLTALFLLFIAASAYLFVWPPTNQPRHVDAILSLNGPDENSREGRAVSLAEQGYAPVLLFSLGRSQHVACPTVPRVQVVCFEPDPGTTLGEIKWASSYARTHGIHSLMIVPATSQAVRARFLAESCFNGRVSVVAASQPAGAIPYNVVYEWAALTRALILYRNC
jgi:uncharacterized SAM-binding protein YcdF (DUF218 family)